MTYAPDERRVPLPEPRQTLTAEALQSTADALRARIDANEPAAVACVALVAIAFEAAAEEAA